MADYWKKKLDELNKSKSSSKSTGDYWESKLTELEKEQKKKKDEDIAPVKKTQAKEEKKSFLDYMLEASTQQYDNPAGAVGAAIGKKLGEALTKEKDGEKWYEGWFQKGSDDTGKAVVGTTADAGTDVFASILGLGEKIVDWGAGIAPYLAQGQYYQNGGDMQPLRMQQQAQKAFDAAKDDAAKFIEKDLYDEEKVAKWLISGMNSASYLSNIAQNGGYVTPEQYAYSQQIREETQQYLDNEMEEDSVFAHKMDELMQSVGQLAGTAAISATGIPWWVVSGTSAWGAESESALKQGATLEEANLSGLISGSAEVLTEQISGGIKFGGKTLDDALTKRLAANISNKFWRNAAKMGMDMAGEGLEEVLSEDISRFGQWLTYQDENTLVEMLWSEEAMDAKIQAFLSGAALGGGGSVTNTVKSTISGVDAVSGLTENEQKVVDKVFEERIAEAEKDGALTSKEKTEIYNDILNKMEKGYISTDTIERVLGGETYKAYKDTIDSEDALKKELDELRQMKSGDMNDIQKDRLAELKGMNFEDTTKRDSLREQLDTEIQGLVNGSKLAESYNERTRRGQAFEADLTKYDAKQQETIKKAVESGILNNTNRTHEFVDLIAKVSADKGVLFDFTNNERLKESGFAVDGKTVNGYVTKDGVTLNIQSAKALESVVGHEITHILEGTELYTELQNSLFEYAKAKGEYDSRLANLTELYKGIKDADVNAELTADLVGDYLFNDTDFVNRLSTENRNLFQKIYDEIKYLCKVATAGSKEARQLEKAKKAFEDAYRANGKASGDTKYSISETTDGRFAAVVDNDILSNINTSTWDKTTKKAAQKAASIELKKFSDGFTINGIEFIGNKDTRDEYTRSDYTDALARKDHTAFLDKMRATAVLDDVIQVATDWKNDDGLKYDREDYVDFVRGKTLVMSGEKAYRAVVLAGITSEGKAIFHDVVDIYPDSFEIKKLESPTAVSANESPNAILGNSNAPKLAQKGSDVKGQFSLSDSYGKQLSKGQQEYFKDSKIRDENGNLKVMYHGSPESFTEFDRKKAKASGYYGSGFYFTDSDSHAKQYGNTYEVYLNITNPVQDGTNDITKEQLRKFVEAVADNEDYGIDNYGYGATVDSVTDGVYGKSDFAMLMDINASCVGNMVEAIELFNEVNGTNYNGIIAPTETVAFYPNQIKSTANTEPTKAADIRYSLTEYTEDEKQAHNKAVLDHFGKTYRWAETGYILLDGSKLDLSGKHEGAPGGYRTVDHRDIVDALGSDYGDDTYSGSLVQFMSEGNIRISPESDGINLSVKPNKAQEQALVSFIQNAHGEVLLDIDDANGYTVVSVEYPSGTSALRVLNDIRGWFDNGKKPEVSNLSQFRSLSEKGEQAKTNGKFYGKDIALESAFSATEEVAPVAEESTATVSKTENVAPVAENKPVTRQEMQELFPDDLAPAQTELDRLVQEKKDLESQMLDMANSEDFTNFDVVTDRYKEVMDRIEELDKEIGTTESDRVNSLDDADAPPEIEAPMSIPNAPVDNPFYDRDFDTVGNRKVKAYMYENPGVKSFFQEEAMNLLTELGDTVKAERWYNDQVYYDTNGEHGFGGNKRHTSDSIAELLDSWGMSYADIEKGLNAIIEDNGAENIAAAKKLEFMLNDRLLHGYKDFYTNKRIEPNQEYIRMLEEKQIMEYTEEARESFFRDALAPTAEDIAPVAPVKERYEAIKPKPSKKPSAEPKLIRVDNAKPGEKQRKWIGTSTESEAVDGKVLPEDLDQEVINYQPISNKKTLGNANSKLDSLGYDSSVQYFNSQFANKNVSLDDIALGERLIQEAVKRGDTKTAGELIQNVAILGTELGQKVQALSIIKRLTPEGQLGMLQKTVQRGKTKGDKTFDGVELTQDMIDKILSAYGKDGTYDQAYLNQMVEDVKQQIADKMQVTTLEKVNAWRYLAMLGNPKTHIRNIVSNVAMRGTMAVKNAVARTVETIAPVQSRTKTWKSATDDVKAFAQKKAAEMKDIISGDSTDSETASIKAKRDIYKNKILNGVYNFNSDLLGKEDWWFSKPAFTNSLSECLTANGIRTEQDIKKNPEIVAKAIQYATDQSQIAVFRQYSWLANKINEIEQKNAATGVAVGSILPFKKTPINIAKTGLSYSPLGFAKTLTYDVVQVKNGKMEASELIDHLAQNVTGSALTAVGYMLAMSGLLNGAGDDDKEGEYDYQLGKQAYSVNIGGETFSLSWLSPVAMPLFVGANAYEQLVEGKEWNGDVVVQALAQTLDPLSEMSFISSLDSVLSSYDSGFEKFAGIAKAMGQNYLTQFAPTLFSQVATTLDDTKRSTKVAADSDFKFFDETINKLMYKIPGLRNLLEPTTDIWGNEVEQNENFFERAFESFIAPYSRRGDIATSVDEEIKDLYSQTGDTGVIPSIPSNYVNYKDEKYEMSAKEYTEFKKTYGQNALDLMEQLFDTKTYQNADSETRADMVNRVYDYARDVSKKDYLAKQGVEYTNATKDGKEIYKEDPIKGAIEKDLPVDEYVFSTEYPAKYSFFKKNGISYETYANADEDGKRAYSWAYENPGKYTMSKAIADDFMTYYKYKSDCGDFNAKDENGETVSGLKKERVLDYINGLNIDYGQKIILYRSMYDSKADKAEYNYDIVEYLNGRSDISYQEMVTILKELGMTVSSDGTVTW